MIFSSPLCRRFTAFLAVWLLLSPSGLVGAAMHSALSVGLGAVAPTTRFLNTGHIGAGVIVVRADELRNGYALSGADYYHQAALPPVSPFTLSAAVDGGQMIAGTAMVLQADSVTNTGYLASGGVLSIDADSLWTGHRNADYHEVRKVKGGKLYLDGDTVQPGGALAAGAFGLGVKTLTSRAVEFIVATATPSETESNSR